MAKRKNMNEKGPKLLIVESPAKIKTLSKFLGKDFRIMSTFGHIKDLPPKKIGVSINDDNTIELEYKAMKDKAGKIADICKQARQCSEIYLASDPDREGEIISWHIGQEIEKVFADPEKIHRITFNEITKPAVTAAIEHKQHVDMDQVNAQQARRVLDRWVGYEVSPILWKKLAKGLSAGRVQSVALLLVCNRHKEIVAFVPQEYWSFHGLFKVTEKTDLPAELVRISNKKVDIKAKDAAKKVVDEIKKESFSISKITEKKRLKNPTAPFMTSSLQQDAYNKLNFSVDKTMSVAQKLYEGVALGDKNNPEALITYMRTDSLRISDTALKMVRDFVGKAYGKDYLPGKAHMYGKKGAQDAHEAIRPIDVSRTPESVKRYLPSDQYRLYDLIWKRFVASQMKPAEYFMKQVEIKGGKFLFRATGSTLVFDGFLKVYLVEDEEDKATVNIPKSLTEGSSMDLKKIDSKQHFTQPPPSYTEASLVKELEKLGIGRPSTYAAILSTIQKRNYVEKEKKKFIPTELGLKVTDMLVNNLPDIINVTFTAQMEEDLDKIAQGKSKRDKVLLDFYKKFKKDLVAFGGKVIDKKVIETDLSCPECKAMLVIRFGRSGEFVGCSGFPECKFTSNFIKDENGQITLQAAPTEVKLDLRCPQCGKTLVQKRGKFGPFVACPGYPECKYIHQEKLKTPCPDCGKDIIKRTWRGGTFWGCGGYPKCRFSIFGDALEEPCPKCKTPILSIATDKEGKKTKACPRKDCDFKESV